MTRLIFGIFFILLNTQNLNAQQVMSFKKYAQNVQDVAVLDEQYPNAIHVDSSLAVFKSREQQMELLSYYENIIVAMGQFINDSGYIWKVNTQMFNRIYFAADGSVDYFLYSFNQEALENLTSDSIVEFERLVTEFFEQHPLYMKASTHFSQCGPVVFQAPE